MEQKTTKFKQSFAGSVGAGISSVFNASGKRYFILEHKVNSKYHKAGESQPIIIDNIILGRDPKCQVRFDDAFPTVSRQHAAIAKEGENWVLVQLSKTNTTFLNGVPVSDRWYLQNGDEIQLSKNGPKLGFIIPQGEKSMVKSIGMTARLNLFRQQALKPYKTALVTLSAILILAVSGFVGWSVYNNNKWEEKMLTAEESVKILESNHKSQIDSLKKSNLDLQQSAKDLENKLQSMNNGSVSNNPSITASNQNAIGELINDVYYIVCNKIELEFNGEEYKVENCWSGSGFLLNDGRFVTARHVIEGWAYPGDDENLLIINAYANNGGRVVAYFTAYSASGAQIMFTNKDFKMDCSTDEIVVTEDGIQLKIAQLNNNDWAYARVSTCGKLSADNQISNNLKLGTELTILGFPLGLGANSEYDITPIYGTAAVAKSGLDNGKILTTDSNFEHGNSGGPVFAIIDGRYKVVGLVSAGAGRNIGMIVPISVVR